MKIVEYRVYEPGTNRWITEYDNREDAKKRANKLDDESGEPDGWEVKKHVEVLP